MSDTSNSDNPSEIESLHGDSNFYMWRAVIQLHLESMDLWKITSGATPRPVSDVPAPTFAQREWDRASLLARCFLDRHASETITRYMRGYDTAPAMWQALMDNYLQRDAQSLLQSFNALCALRYSAGSLADYLVSFERHWSDLVYRTSDADPPTPGPGNSLEAGLRVVATSDEAKTQFLIASLPEAMDSVVANIVFREGAELTYIRLYRDLVDYDSVLVREQEVGLVEELQGLDCT